MYPVFTALMIISMFAVLVILGLGLFSMTKGGDFNKKYGNKLMRLRVILQGACLVFLMLAMATRP